MSIRFGKRGDWQRRRANATGHSQADALVIEPLEPRVLLSASLGLPTAIATVQKNQALVASVIPAAVPAVLPEVQTKAASLNAAAAGGLQLTWAPPFGTKSGLWEDSGNWGGFIPTAADSVTISGPGSVVSIDEDETVANLTLIDGATLLPAAGTPTGNYVTVTVTGTVTVSNSTLYNITLESGANLYASGTTALSGSSLRIDSGGELINTGTVVVSGTGAQSITGNIDNAGVISLASGNLGFAGGTLTSEPGASLTIAAGSTLDLTEGGGETFGGTLTADGAGTISLADGVLAADPTNGLTLDMRGTLFQWSGGVIDGVDTSLANIGTITLVGNGEEDLGGTLDNAGVIEDSADLDFVYRTYSANYYGTIDNSGIFAFAGDGGIGGNGQVLNTGLFAKVSGTATSTINVDFDNAGGSIAVDSGTLALTGGTVAGGTITTQADATLLLTGAYENSYDFSGTLTGSGAGTVAFDNTGIEIDPAGATVNFAPGQLQWIDGRLNTESAVLRNTGDITFSNAMPGATSVQIGGNVDNLGTITEAGSASANTPDVGVATVTNETGAAIILQDGGGFAGGFTIDNSGLLEMSSGPLSSIAITALNLLPAGTVAVDAGILVLASGGAETDQAFHVTSGATLELSGATYAGTLSSTGSGVVDLAGGTIAPGGATFDFAPGVASWTTGTFDARLGGLTNAGDLTLAGSDAKTIGGSFFANSGTIMQSGGGLQLLYVTYAANYGGTLDNSGTYDITDDGGIGGGQVIDNSGTLLKTGGTGTTDLSAVVDTSGVFGAASGAMTVDDGIDATGGTIEALAGTLTIAGGTLSNTTLDTTTNAASETQSAVTFTANVTFGGVVSGVGTGLVILSPGHDYQAAASGGTVDFAAGELQFQGGELLGGTSSLVNAGELTVNQQITESQLFGLLINTGTLAIAAVSAFDLQGGATIANEAGGVIDFQGDGAIFGVGNGEDGLLINAGTIRKSVGTESSIEVGTLAASGAGAFALGAGTIDLAVDVLAGTLTGTGAGALDLTGVGSSADATLDFTAGTLQWSAGVIDVSTGTLVNIGTLTLIGNALEDLGGTLDNTGTIIQLGGELGLDAEGGHEGGVLDNQGLYELEDDGLIFNNFVNGGLLDNTGVLRATGTGASAINTDRFSNTGTVDTAAGTLSVNNLEQYSAGTLTGGTWTVENGATLTFGVALTGNAANLALSGAGSAVSGLAALAENTGTLGVDDGAGVTLAGSLTNGGVLLAGPSGTITIAGDLDETATGVVETVLDGRPATQAFGTITVTGDAALAGTLDVALATGFAPTGDDSYVPLTYATASGSFASEMLPAGVQATVGAGDVTLNVSESGADLAVGAVTVETASAAPGQPVTVQFTVANEGGIAATGTWTDSVYLSTNGALDPADVLLGRVIHTGDVAAGASYVEGLTAVLPPLADGAYTIVVLADSLDQVADSNRADNVGASSTTVAAATPALTLGTPVAGSLAGGQDIYYEINVQPGANISIAGTFADAGVGQIFVSDGSVPTPSSFDQTASPATGTQDITVTGAASGTIYVLVHSLASTDADTSFSLLATTTPLSITGLTSTSGTNDQTDVIIGLTGAQFTSHTTVSLVAADGTAYAAESSDTLFQTAIAATFDLTTIPAGTYTVVAKDGQAVASAAAPYTVVPLLYSTDVTALQVTITSPSDVIAGGGGAAIVEPIPVTVSFYNPTNTPILISNFDLLADNATFTKLPALYYGIDPTLPADALEIAALISPSDPVLVPAGGTVGFDPQANPNPDQPNILCVFSGQFEDVTDGPLDLDALSAAIKPASVAQNAWNAIFQNLSAAIGATTASLATLEQNDEALLQVASGASTSPSDADSINLEVLKANDALPTPVLDSATDVSYPAPGISLSFGRAFQSSIIGRYSDGRLGQGWVDNWDYVASEDTASDTVTIQEGAGLQQFTANADGSFTAAPGNSTTLTETNGAFRLASPDGDVVQFNADGTLDYVQDADGNRISAGYTNGLMTSLTAASGGDALTIAYNAQGKIASVTDPTGWVAQYTYDTTGQELLSVTTPAGTSTYSYSTATTGPTAFELASITDPGSTSMSFSYDSEGRLTMEAGNEGAEAVTYAYGATSVQVTDAAGDTSTYYFNQTGATVAAVDPLGRVTTQTYDDIGEVTSTGEIGGGRSTINTTTSATGTTETVTGQTGGVTALTFGANPDELTSTTDQDGNVTSYSYAADGDLTAVTYANGTQESYTHAADGSVTETVDRNGTAASYTYDSRGLLLSETLSDGTTSSYTYDVHGNMLTATDASGTITMTYNAAGALTNVVYPNGQFLTYSYDAGGRLTMSTDQDGFVTNYSYNAQGQLSAVTDGDDGLIASYTYDAVGRLVRQDNGNATYTTRSYDADGNVLSIINYAPNGSVNSSFVYTYDGLGLVATMTTLAGTASYAYDAAGRLTRATLTDGTTISYAYDAAGNRTVTVENGVSTTYTTNDLDEYITVGGGAQSYDDDGDLISGGGSTYTYNALGQLTAVFNASGSWSYTYNALGQRSSATHEGVVTNFLVDPTTGNIVAEYDAGGALIASYTYGAGLTSRVAPGGTEYYDFDAQGSTAGLSGANGNYVASYTYDPTGNLLSSTGSAANRFLFNGAAGVQSDGSGLVTMGARSYDPQTGRFTQPDPSGIIGGINPYVADDNNPVSLVDPSGLNPGLGPDTINEYGNTGVDLSGVGTVTAQTAQTLSAQASPGFGTAQSGIEIFGGLTRQQFLALNENELGDLLRAYNDSLAQAEPAIVQVATQTEQTVAENPVQTVETVGLLVTFGRAIASVFGFVINAFGATPPGVIINAALTGGTLGYFLYDYDVAHGTTFGIGRSTTKLLAGPADPNLIAGPSGYGDAQYITGSSTDPYYLAFTNEPTADAPARTVTVTQQLDPNLDLTTFQLDAFGFGDTAIVVPAGLQDYTIRIDDRAAAGVFVDVSIQLDVATRTLTASYTSIDPTTLDDETDPLIGFLPPDTAAPMGTGWLSYSVSPDAGLASGTTITAQASVVFDSNAPVITNAYVNTIDNDPPTSQVAALPPVVASPAIALVWSGSDGAGSGIASYDIYVSDDGGAYTAFLQNTTATAATFTGIAGHTYSFYSTATDNVGFTEQPPATPDATTRVDVAPVASNITGAVLNAGPTITLTATFTDPDPGDTHSFAIDTTGTKGEVTNNGDGTFTYNPNGAFAALTLGQTATDSFSYTVTDGEGLSSTAVATITVTGVDTAPLAANITGSVSSTGAAITLTAAYTDPDIGDSHSFTVNTANTKGSVTNNGDGTFTYNPNGAFAALTLGQTATDSFAYTVIDGEGLSSTAVATITVTGVDTAPVAANITGAVSSAGPAVTLTAVYTDPVIGDKPVFTVNTTNTKGSVTNNGDGTFTYNPNGAFAALTPGQTATDSFAYTVTDGEGLSSTAVATITVTGVDTAPVAANITGAVSSAGPAITLTTVYTDPVIGDKPVFTVNTTNTKGSVTNNGDGTFTYTPNGAFAALTLGQTATDSFSYTVTDGESLSSTAVATITVTGVDTAPVAANITGTVSSAGPAITLTAAYTDPDAGDSHSFTVDTTNTKGSVVNNGDGTFTYTPNGAFASLTPGQTATDSFLYTVTDGEGLSSTAVATVTVIGVGATPTANPDGPYVAILSAPLVVNAASGLLANDTGPAGETLSAVLVQAPSHGTLKLNADGSFTYLAACDYVGADSFTYRAVDAAGASAPATVAIDVQNKLTLSVAAHDFEGGASFTVAVDGVQVGGVETVTSSFAAGQHTDITLAGDFPINPQQVTVTFINDLYEGTPRTDRNLYVKSLSIDGHFFLGSAASNPVGHAVGGATVLYSDGTVTFDVARARLDTLTLGVAANLFAGGAALVVAADGVQIGGTPVVNAPSTEGLSGEITLTGDFGPAPRDVSVTLADHLRRDVPSTDLGMFVESLTIFGRTLLGESGVGAGDAATGLATALSNDGTITFTLPPVAGHKSGGGRAIEAQPSSALASDIRILTNVAAQDFGLSPATVEADAAALEPWIVALVRGQSGARDVSNGVIVDLFGSS